MRVDDVPAVCPTCGTTIPEGATRCPGCGRVFGEDNRCPHCHAIAGVLERGGRTVCAACGGARTIRPGTVVLGRGGGAAIAPADVARGASVALRLASILAIGGGVLGAALMAIILPGAFSVVGALLVGGLGVGLGAMGLRRASAGGVPGVGSARELEVIALAESRGGELTATDVARRFGWTTRDADAFLTSLVDGTRVTLEVDPNGLLRYVFREVQAAGPRVRVGEGEDDAEGVEHAEAEATPGARREDDQAR